MHNVQAKILASLRMAVRFAAPTKPPQSPILFPSLFHPLRHSAQKALYNKLSPQHIRNNRMQSSSSISQLQDSSLGSLSSAPTVPAPPPLVIIISGPSGVGKDAVIRRLQEKRPDIHFVITATSRPMRPGEIDGIDYFFVSREIFESWIKEEKLLEHAVVYGEYKGIPRKQVDGALARGTDVVLRIDVQGAETMRRLLPGLFSIFLVAESEEALVKRLISRKTEPEDKMKIRVKTAREEMSHISNFDYVVVNEDGKLEKTVEEIEAIIVAEKLKVSRRCANDSSHGS